MSTAGAVRVPESTLREYRRFSLYNSPYPAHGTGCAIDLYPETNEGLSPVAGEVIETKAVRAPSKPYARDDEYLVLVDVDLERSGLDVSAERSGVDVDGSAATEADADGLVARVLHVRPRVEPGDAVAVGDPLGEMIRSGFFAPWVANHVHVGFRTESQNPHRADGSLPVVSDVDVEPLPWDGVGTVVEAGATYALLDAPDHPAPGDRFVGLSGVVDANGPPCAVEKDAASGTSVALDGGFAHYAGGGILGGAGTVDGRDARNVPRETSPESGTADGTVSFLGHPIGDRDGRNVTWRDVDVVANGERITGLSLFAALDPTFGAKLVCPDADFAVGERVRVTVRDGDDPIRLG